MASLTPLQLKELYLKQQINISREIRGQVSPEHLIELSYDLQAGSYVKLMQLPDRQAAKRRLTEEIVRTVRSYCEPHSLVEAGVGEATTLAGVLQGFARPDLPSYGFDLSWSRLAYARHWLDQQGLSQVTLCTGSLLNIPFQDDSVDVVYTSNSVEPNAGSEAAILKELYRITGRLLILIEPCYELGDEAIRRRMDELGYCKNLKGIAEELGYRVVEHRAYLEEPLRANNPAAVTVIEKRREALPSFHPLACPKFKTPVVQIGSVYYSPEGLMAYPILNGIACLRSENGILASAYPDMTR